ncbi:phage tail tape measure protein, lambda family [Palleronia salina]|uniref:Phage tail tape measure protein, lambda family n=1 Tax=Palleronia salina TaxID=313368 RepID=A0A1M6AFH8_9RHOB|nr:phage tail tape measure protein [Palleronia salina]SHI35048.1 phage tail tape measure protein, lambda family [Palleronia salina]
MTYRSDPDQIEEMFLSIEDTVGGTRAVLAAFDAELRAMGSTVADTSREVGTLSRGISRGLKRNFEGLVYDGAKLSDALQGVAQSMVNAAYNAAINPVARHVGGVLATGVEGMVTGLMPFAEGGAFSQGRALPQAGGGVVSGATAFPMRGGAGLMGEAGPEAIMPLTRGADGRLGVAASGGGRPVQVTINVSTPDVEGFRRSQSQIAARMGRALSQGQRNR